MPAGSQMVRHGMKHLYGPDFAPYRRRERMPYRRDASGPVNLGTPCALIEQLTSPIAFLLAVQGPIRVGRMRVWNL